MTLKHNGFTLSIDPTDDNIIIRVSKVIDSKLMVLNVPSDGTIASLGKLVNNGFLTDSNFKLVATSIDSL
jgi:hypothetical protein